MTGLAKSIHFVAMLSNSTLYLLQIVGLDAAPCECGQCCGIIGGAA